MGSDIDCFAEKRNKETKKWELVETMFPYDEDYDYIENGQPFTWRNYLMFGLFAGVRDSTNIKPLSKPRGLPDDVSDEVRKQYDPDDYHSASFLTVKELLSFDYDAKFDDEWTWRDALDEDYFEHLEILKSLGEPDDVRIVFWFD